VSTSPTSWPKDVIFDYIITTPGYPRHVGLDRAIEKQAACAAAINCSGSSLARPRNEIYRCSRR